MSEKRRALLAQKQKILDEIKYYEKRIEDAQITKSNVKYFEDESSDSDTDLTAMVDLGPTVSELRQQRSSLQTRLQAAIELTSLQVVQVEANIMTSKPEVTRSSPIKEEGTWKEVTAECRVDLVPFCIAYYTFQPSRNFSNAIFRNLTVTPGKKAHEAELSKSVLPELTRPSDAVEVLKSYAIAHRSRRTSLAQLAETFGSALQMEPKPGGGYILKCADLMEMSWTLQNKWSPIAPFHHKMSFDLEYMDESYIKIISQTHRQLSDPSVDTDDRTLLLTKIINTCLEAQGPTRELYESMESDPEVAKDIPTLRKRKTTFEQEPEMPEIKRQKVKEVMAPPKTVPKKAKSKPKGKENVGGNVIGATNAANKVTKDINSKDNINNKDGKENLGKNKRANDVFNDNDNDKLSESDGREVIFNKKFDGKELNEIKNAEDTAHVDSEMAAKKPASKTETLKNIKNGKSNRVEKEKTSKGVVNGNNVTDKVKKAVGKDNMSTNEKGVSKEKAVDKDQAVDKDKIASKEKVTSKVKVVGKDKGVGKDKTSINEKGMGKEKVVAKEQTVGTEKVSSKEKVNEVKEVGKEKGVGKEKTSTNVKEMGKEKAVAKELGLGKDKVASKEKVKVVGKDNGIGKEQAVAKEKNINKEAANNKTVDKAVVKHQASKNKDNIKNVKASRNNKQITKELNDPKKSNVASAKNGKEANVGKPANSENVKDIEKAKKPDKEKAIIDNNVNKADKVAGTKNKAKQNKINEKNSERDKLENAKSRPKIDKINKIPNKDKNIATARNSEKKAVEKKTNKEKDSTNADNNKETVKNTENKRKTFTIDKPTTNTEIETLSYDQFKKPFDVNNKDSKNSTVNLNNDTRSTESSLNLNTKIPVLKTNKNLLKNRFAAGNTNFKNRATGNTFKNFNFKKASSKIPSSLNNKNKMKMNFLRMSPRLQKKTIPKTK